MSVFFIDSSKRAPLLRTTQRRCVTAPGGSAISGRPCLPARIRGRILWVWTPQGYSSFRRGWGLSTTSLRESFRSLKAAQARQSSPQMMRFWI